MEKCEELDFEVFKIKSYEEDLTEQINSVIQHIKKTKALNGIFQNIKYSVKDKFINIYIKGNLFSIIKYPIKIKREDNSK